MGTYSISENVVMGKEDPWPQGIHMTVNKLAKKWTNQMISEGGEF